MENQNSHNRSSGIDMSIEEQRLTYDKLEQMINGLGDLKNVVNNKQVILSLLTSNVDRHILCAFFEKINKMLTTGELEQSDLRLLRSGWLVEQIINLEELVNQSGRLMFPFEIGDKLNYVSLLRDIPSLNATYANPKLVEAINKTTDYKIRQQLLYWTGSSLPLETKLNVAKEFLKNGNMDYVMEILSDTTSSLALSREREERYKEHQSRTR